MSDSKSPKLPFPEAVRALSEEERRDLPFVPTEDALVAYQAGELSDEAADQVRRYLAIDPEAARFVADLDQFLHDVEDKSLHLSDHETAQGLRALQREPGGGSSPGGSWFFKAAAAVFLVTTVVSVLWGMQQRGHGDVFAGGMSITMLDDLEPQNGNTRGPKRGQKVGVPQGDRDFALVFPLEPRLDQVVVVRGDGVVVDDALDVRYSVDLSCQTVRLLTANYPAGQYILRLLGSANRRNGEKPQILKEYPFEVVYVSETR